MKLERIQFLKNNLLPASGNYGESESSFQIVMLFWLGMDSRNLFLLVESITEIIVHELIPFFGSPRGTNGLSELVAFAQN